MASAFAVYKLLARIKTDQKLEPLERIVLVLMATKALSRMRELMAGKHVIARNARQHSGFIWADKVVLFAVGVLLSLLALCWLLAFLTIGSLGAEHLWRYMGVQSIEMSLLVGGSLFVMMRGIDFAIGGPTFRLFVASKRRLNSIAAEFYAHHR